MTGLDEIEERVNKTICITGRISRQGDMVESLEGRISRTDFDMLMRAARSAVVLRQFRDFVCREAKVWSLDGSHHNPIWQRVAEALDAVGLNDGQICRVCDALDPDHQFAYVDLCPGCAAALGGGLIVVSVGSMIDDDTTGKSYPCDYPDCENELPDPTKSVPLPGSPSAGLIEKDRCSACGGYIGGEPRDGRCKCPMSL